MSRPKTSFITTFRYSPLQSATQIRLVSLLPKDRADISICGVPLIQCSMVTVDLAEGPEFDALSYAWGNPYPEKPRHSSGDLFDFIQGDGNYSEANKWPVSVDGRLLYVTKNLYEGLLEFQSNLPARPAPDAKVEARDPVYNKTALIASAEKGQAVEVKRLLREGSDVRNVDKYGETALHYAAENGHYEVVRILVEAGSDIQKRDRTNRTPLQCAKQRKRREWDRVCKLLAKRHDVGKIRPLWIDAICINQEDIPERNAQVLIMSDIYSKARRVVVWLGVEDDSTALAIETMSLMNSTPLNDWQDWMWTAHSNPNLPEDENSSLYERTEWITKTLPGFRALLALVNRTWFKRIWVIQEITSASELTCICGSQCISWDDLFRVLQRQFHPYDDPSSGKTLLSIKSSPPLKFRTGNKGSEAQILTEVRLRTRPDVPERHYVNEILGKQGLKQALTWNSRLSLPILLSYAWNFQATDPKDKLFALRSFVKPEDQQKIEIDYFRSVEDVFVSMAPIFLRGSGEEVLQNLVTGEYEGLEPLEGLSFIQNHKIKRLSTPRKLYLPSWVPDFGFELLSSRIFPRRFHASTQIPHDLAFEGKIFTVRGLEWDEVAQLGKESNSLGRDNLPSHDPVDWLRLANTLEQHYAATGQNRAEVLWRTLMLDDIESVGLEEAKRSFREFMGRRSLYHFKEEGDLYEKLQSTDDSNSLAEIEDFIYNEDNDVTVMHFSVSGKNLRFFGIVWATYYLTRRLFTTARGYLGLGPGAMENGDRVVLFAGARTPFVIRLVNTTTNQWDFKFIGEAYVHGIMQGEAVEGREDEFGPIRLV